MQKVTYELEWHKADDPPPVKDQFYIDELRSEVVLVYFREGTINTAFYTVYDSGGKDELRRWYTADSECWNVTGEILYWAKLPLGPTL